MIILGVCKTFLLYTELEQDIQNKEQLQNGLERRFCVSCPNSQQQITVSQLPIMIIYFSPLRNLKEITYQFWENNPS